MFTEEEMECILCGEQDAWAVRAFLHSIVLCTKSRIVLIRVYLIDKLKISEVGDKREYRIYRNFIGDREIFSDKI